MTTYPFGKRRQREQTIDKIANRHRESLVALVIDLQTRSGYSVCCKTEGVHGSL